MHEHWLNRWREGRIGWHEADGNVFLRRYWPRLVRGSRVLVPLCGKSIDLLWLAQQGLDVTGVEISDIAARAFFRENDLGFRETTGDGLPNYEAVDLPVRIYCGDYLEFRAQPFDALFDRGALVALPGAMRSAYAGHTDDLLRGDAYRMVITLDYRQAAADGPPYAVQDSELLEYWPTLERLETRNDIANSPQKFRDAGLTEVLEKVWASS